MCKWLLERGANPNSKDRDGRPPLWQAVKAGSDILTESLLQNNAESDFTIDGQTLLSETAAQGHKRMVELLLTYGAGADYTPSDYSRTPLSRAAEEGHGAVVELLLKHGACIDNMDIEHGRTPLWWAADKGHVEVVKLLLENGADKYLDDNDGRTPLSRAAANKCAAVLKILKGEEADAA
jgi:ankyrin repeat protein